MRKGIETPLEHLEKSQTIFAEPVANKVVDSKHAEEYLKLKEAELTLRRGLPHLHGLKHYPWSRAFFDTTERLAFVCAANQIGKSTVQIRKVIDWCTDTGKWDRLWPGYPTPPLMIYFYPTSAQASIEFSNKWSRLLPRDEYKTHPHYGWREEWKNKEIFALHFNTGASVYYKSYKQGMEALQTVTAHYVALDEECPEELWSEIVMRTQAVQGYISSVFTATIGQELWRKTIEPANDGDEKFPGAFKRQVSMYDCQEFEDGTKSHWTNERISQVIASCKSSQEVQRRVFGKFVVDSGLIYQQFDVKRHFKPWHPVPVSWLYYVGVDIGSGGSSGHPSSICFTAVSPDYKQARVVASWRGDGIPTTASDVFKKYLEMEEELQVKPVLKTYDWSSAEFGAIASQNGSGFVKADKSHETGQQVINVLFRNDMLAIYDRYDNGKLVAELSSLTHSRAKRNAADDLTDAMRYSLTRVPFDWSGLGLNVIAGSIERPEEKRTPMQVEVEERRAAFMQKTEEERIEHEFEEWNSSYDGH